MSAGADEAVGEGDARPEEGQARAAEGGSSEGGGAGDSRRANGAPPGDVEGLLASTKSEVPGAAENSESEAARDRVESTRTLPLDGTSEARPLLELPVVERRYRVEGFLGAGGMGEVFSARDDLLDREVAIKFAGSARDEGGEALAAAPPVAPGVIEQLVREARTAGRLDHPNIPPVFDLGLDRHGFAFYVMRRIRGHSLKEILAERASGASPWTLPRLLTLFQQACLALEFAHSRGILHLDVKPANIMVGEFGELYLVDWGLSASAEEERSQGIRGTLAYMSPEQARGGAALTGASDVFSLGVVLYEIVTGELAFPGEESAEILARVREARFATGASWASLSPELQEILRGALARTPGKRLASARALHDEIQEFLEGTRERERKLEAARAALRAVRGHLDRHRERLERAAALASEVERKRPESWRPTREKREFWKVEDELRRVRDEARAAVERATARTLEAYGHAPDESEVRSALGGLYWQRFREAEEAGDESARELFEEQLRRLDLPEHRAALEGRGALEVRCTPAAERAVIHKIAERMRQLTPFAPRELDPRDLRWPDIPMGSWQLTLERLGFRTIRVPIHIGRAEHVRIECRFIREEELGADFVQVPAGSFLMGGDPDTFMSVPRSRPFVPEFFIARHPVTWEQYREFLELLRKRSPEQAERRLPRISADGTPTWSIDPDRGVRFASTPEYERARRRWPIFCISYDDALAYCEFMGERDGRPYRLPDDAEWEKAARGTDGRIFPWGNRYDASFCKNAGSTAGKAQPEAVGSYPRDRSPYGVCDVAGTIREWCASWFREKDNLRLVRGGSWNFDEIGAHCAYRLGCSPDAVYPFIGFRLAFSRP